MLQHHESRCHGVEVADVFAVLFSLVVLSGVFFTVLHANSAATRSKRPVLDACERGTERAISDGSGVEHRSAAATNGILNGAHHTSHEDPSVTLNAEIARARVVAAKWAEREGRFVAALRDQADIMEAFGTEVKEVMRTLQEEQKCWDKAEEIFGLISQVRFVSPQSIASGTRSSPQRKEKSDPTSQALSPD